MKTFNNNEMTQRQPRFSQRMEQLQMTPENIYNVNCKKWIKLRSYTKIQDFQRQRYYNRRQTDVENHSMIKQQHERTIEDTKPITARVTTSEISPRQIQ